MNLPEDFKMSIVSMLGKDEADALFAALATQPPVSVRFNDKCELTPTCQLQRVPWCGCGWYLNSRPQFAFDPFWHSGCYYVQEASSMFLRQALEQYVDRDALVLDTCAAPGGKSTLIADYISKNGFLISNEYVAQRAHILVENIRKWGAPNCMVTTGDVAKFEQMEGWFDAVCVDAPCSGEGMFRKDEGAVAEWSLQNVAMCVERQRTILESAWLALKSGGVLVYSTCTYNRNENEDNVEWLMDEYGAEYLPVNIDKSWGVTDTGRGYRFFPHKTRGEGLFLAVLRKPEDGGRIAKLKSPKRAPEKADQLLDWLVDGKARYSTIVREGAVVAVPRERYDMAVAMLERFNVLSVGVTLATVKGRDYIPHEALALSKVLRRGVFPEVDIDRITALQYLRSEAIAVDAPKGFVLMTYRGVPLGWVKNLGNRANNLYPQYWRLRASIPEDFNEEWI